MISIPTGLPDIGSVAWAARKGPILLTAQMPVRHDGTFETGGLEAQLDLCLANLSQTLRAANGSLSDVIQVIVYFVEEIDRQMLNQVWERYFAPPWPNRSILGVRQLAIPGVIVHLTATAWLEP